MFLAVAFWNGAALSKVAAAFGYLGTNKLNLRWYPAQEAMHAAFSWAVCIRP